jgi:hypothetical protein
VAWAEKPNISSDKILTQDEQKEVKEYLKGKIFIELQPIKNDYIDEYNRGTVKFNPKKGRQSFDGDEVFETRNYSFHKVIIPDGTILKGINFTQRNPYTKAIEGDNLTFINCNLSNNKIEQTWILINCNNTQWLKEIVIKNGIKYELHKVEKDGKFIEVDREKVDNSISD